jgi:hypothetical protein
MKQKFLIFIGAVVVIGALILLNAAAFVQRERLPDNEIRPNRSTFNTGATGTRAFYELLAETGRRVTRWQEPPANLFNYNRSDAPTVFVIIGETRREISEEDANYILDWTAAGNTLILIDRQPEKNLITTTANWRLAFSSPERFPTFEIDPGDTNQMTAGTPAARPVEPTIFTGRINAVQPSRFAASIVFERFPEAEVNILPSITDSEQTDENADIDENADFGENPEMNFIVGEESKDGVYRLLQQKPPPPPPPAAAPVKEPDSVIIEEKRPAAVSTAPASSDVEEQEPPDSLSQIAPVVHLSDGGKNILVDVPYGSGRIVFLSDPFIVSNGGIALVDNAQAGINAVAHLAGGGTIAFDEYHQGYGAGDNRLLEYFAGTPVVPIIAQLALLIGLIFFSQSRRFARPLPASEPNRLSKLEYVAAMAELQQRTNGYDLAIENIYTDFRRRVARLFGVDNQSTSRKDLAALLAERLERDEQEIDDLLRRCEDVMHGEPTNKRTVLQLAGELRGIEQALGLRRTGRKIQ